jgi:hypothetical protein
MEIARDHIETKPGVPVYSELFFTRQYRFQYPPSSLFALEILRLAGPERVRIADGMTFVGWPPVNDIVAWGFVALTAIATAGLLDIHLRRRQVIAGVSSLTVVRVLAVIGLTLTFYPVVKAFTLGQIQVWINGLFALSLLCWTLDRKALGGVLIGIVCLIKPHYALLLLWGAWRRQWRFVLAGGAMIAIGLAASVAVYGWANHVDYLRVLSFLSAHGEAYYPNQSVNGLLNRWFSREPALQFLNLEIRGGQFPPFNPWVYGPTLAASVLILAAALLRRMGPDNGAWDLSRMAVSCTMASPIAWEHHYGVVLPVFAIVLAAAAADRARLAWLVASYVLISTFVPAVNLLAPTLLNPLQSHLLAGAFILLAILHRGPEPVARTAVPASVAAMPPGRSSLPRSA